MHMRNLSFLSVVFLKTYFTSSVLYSCFHAVCTMSSTSAVAASSQDVKHFCAIVFLWWFVFNSQESLSFWSLSLCSTKEGARHIHMEANEDLSMCILPWNGTADQGRCFLFFVFFSPRT